jgi:hypothetical protein
MKTIKLIVTHEGRMSKKYSDADLKKIGKALLPPVRDRRAQLPAARPLSTIGLRANERRKEQRNRSLSTLV